jgi:hypothetical protein
MKKKQYDDWLTSYMYYSGRLLEKIDDEVVRKHLFALWFKSLDNIYGDFNTYLSEIVRIGKDLDENVRY